MNLPLLVNSEGREPLLRPVDPVSLQDLQGFPPFLLGPHHYVFALSPDRRVLAAMSYPTGVRAVEVELELFDLAAWTETTTTLMVRPAASLLFAPDGKALYWASSSGTGDSQGATLDFRLYRYEMEGDKLEEVLHFPATFWPGEMRFLRSGRLAVYGVPTNSYVSSGADPVYFTGRAPRVLLVAPDAGRIVADVALEGVKDGLYRDPAPENAFSDSQEYRPGLAWDMAGDRLYVAHPDSDEVTVVDLARGKALARTDVHQRLSLWDRVLGRFVTAVEAKQVPETERKVALSPDGATLYITGIRRDLVKHANGQLYYCVVSHGGLRAVSTGAQRELRKLDIAADSIAVSPDGKTLLLRGATTGQLGCDNSVGGLYVVDAQSLEVRAHLEPQASFGIYGFSYDGRYAYVGFRGPSGGFQGPRVLDLGSLEYVAQRSVANFLRLHPAIEP